MSTVLSVVPQTAVQAGKAVRKAVKSPVKNTELLQEANFIQTRIAELNAQRKKQIKTVAGKIAYPVTGPAGWVAAKGKAVSAFAKTTKAAANTNIAKRAETRAIVAEKLGGKLPVSMSISKALDSVESAVLNPIKTTSAFIAKRKAASAAKAAEKAAAKAEALATPKVKVEKPITETTPISTKISKWVGAKIGAISQRLGVADVLATTKAVRSEKAALTGLKSKDAALSISKKITGLNSQKTALNDQITALQGELAQKATAEKRIQSRIAKAPGIQGEKESAEEKLRITQSTLAKLKNKPAKSATAKRKAAVLSKTIISVEAEIAKKESQLSRISALKADTKERKTAAKAIQAEISGLNKEIASIESQIAKLSA